MVQIAICIRNVKVPPCLFATLNTSQPLDHIQRIVARL